MSNKIIKYFCNRCGSAKAPKVVILFHDPERRIPTNYEVLRNWFKNEAGQLVEIKKDNPAPKDAKIIKTRMLDCNHIVDFYTPGFTEEDSENLSEIEAQVLRESIQKDMVGLGPEEIQSRILFHVEKYRTLLTLSSKQVKQAKYGLLILEQLKEKFSEQLKTDDDKAHFEMLFDHVFNPGRVSEKTVRRELTKKEKDAEKEVHGKAAGIDAATALLKKMGYSNEEFAAMLKAKGIVAKSDNNK